MPPTTTYHIITRLPKQTPPSTVYQKLPEPVGPFGLDRSPPFQFLQRLRNFPPNLDDVLVVASTASIDIGLITKSKVPLSGDAPGEKISNVYTTTMMAEDSRRAQMPMSQDLADTSPIGLGFDLSSKDKVERPLPAEEYDTSQGPLPALMVLNNEGLLSVWWFVYAESIRLGTNFPGLVVEGGHQQLQTERQAPSFTSAAPQPASTFGQMAFGDPSTTTRSPFTSAFGSTTTPGPAFGTTSALGKSASPFGSGMISSPTSVKTGPTFGQPGLGAGPASQGMAFGVATTLGSRSSPWGTPSTGTTPASGHVFGQSGFNAPKAAPFGTVAPPTTNTSGGFAAFASKPSSFMTAPSSGDGSLFGKATSTATFDTGMDTDTSFGVPAKSDRAAEQPSFATEHFTLGSTFKKDSSTAKDLPKPTNNTGASLFGSGFGESLGIEATNNGVVTPQMKDADMDSREDAPLDDTQAASADMDSTTHATTPAPSKLSFPPPSVPPKTGGLFGTQAQSTMTPASVGNSQPTCFTIGTVGNPPALTTTPENTPHRADQMRPSVKTSPEIKKEPHSDDSSEISPLNEYENAPPLGFETPEAPRASNAPDAPLPPESTSKASFAPGDSSNSSKSSDDAPMPPDFLPAKTKLKEVEVAPPAQTALPLGDEDEESEGLTDQGSYDGEEEEASDEGSANLDEEGSGIDVAQEISPTTDPTQSPKITPGSSFGGLQDKTSPGGLFGRITAPPDRSRGKMPLFGEVGKTSAPYLPPPSKTQESPRSPSPVRSNMLTDSLRPENLRSISAPGPFEALSKRKATLAKEAAPLEPQQSPSEVREQMRKQLAAETAKAREEEEQDLSDREDERVREELATEVEATLTLDQFLAHQDYNRDNVKPGVPGQIEKVYRDINSMIDTLGINARSLKAFIKGHEQKHKSDGARTRDDLEKDDWCLIEIEDLPKIEDDLFEKLENGRTRNSQETMDECQDLREELKYLRTNCKDIVRTVEAHSDPNEMEVTRNAPLSLDQITGLDDLRKKMTKFQKLVTEAEENISMLRAKLAACDTSNGKGPPLKKPTVEAVTNTVLKMTNIIKSKNNNIEALEDQMSHLRFSSVGSLSGGEDSLFNRRSSRPQPASRYGASVNGHHYSPGQSSRLSRSANGDGTPRKGIADISPAERAMYKEKARRRQEINEIMRREFEKDGPRIRPLESL